MHEKSRNIMTGKLYELMDLKLFDIVGGGTFQIRSKYKNEDDVIKISI
jgi:hypothetical protein